MKGLSLCNELADYALRIWNESLSDLAKSPLSRLISDFRRVYDDFDEFKSTCYNKLDQNVYKYYEGVFTIALLKLSVAIEERVKGGDVRDETVKLAVEMFTPDEKGIVKELERFSGLELSPEVLAELIVARKGEVYELIKEAVSKQYVDLANVVKTWAGKYNISDSVRRGLLYRYERRFKNVVEAFKRLLEQQPAWLVRLFSEYEEVLLSSGELRSKFERELKETYAKEVSALKERLEVLEKEREALLNKLIALSEREASRDVEKEALAKELNKLREDYELLKSKYQEVLTKWEERSKELEELGGKLVEKERELEEIAKREKELSAAKEACEAEILRLKSVINEYEAKVKEYERYKEELQLELKAMEDRVRALERGLKGELKGHLVTAEEAAMLELIFVEKLRGKLRDLPLVLETPWGEVTIKKWSYEWVSEELGQGMNLPRNVSVVFGYRSRGFLGLGEEKVIEIRGIYLSHVNTLRKQGLDSQPATLSELLSVLKNHLYSTSVNGRRFVLIGVASPTGWEEFASKYVMGEERPSLVFGDVVVILVDLIENKAIYPTRLSKVMPSIDRYARMFLPEVRVEEEALVREALKQLCREARAKVPPRPTFLYRDLVERLKGVSRLSIMRVLHECEEEGIIEVKSVNGEKTILCKSAGW